MANQYSTVRYGSTGDEVRRLQEMLNQSGGYNLAVDGSFGSDTKNAVMDYQRKNGLSADGIVGNNTWGALTEYTQKTRYGETEDPQGSGPQTAAASASYPHGQYQQGGSQPPTYESRYDQQIKDAYDAIMNRQGFQFNLGADTMYQQYKDQYQQLGKQAMTDTMGQAAALTGGYGSSYGQAVGQQQYNAYLQRLNDVIPDIYAQQRSAYDAETSDLKNRYAMLMDAENQDYSRFLEEYNRWKNDAEDKANLLAGVGDFSGLRDLYGLTDEQVNALMAAYGGGSGSSATGMGSDTGDGSDPTFMERLIGTAREGMGNYADIISMRNTLNRAVANGTMSQEKALEIFTRYMNTGRIDHVPGTKTTKTDRTKPKAGSGNKNEVKLLY